MRDLHLEGTYVIKAPRKKVFDFVSNPKSVSRCLPDLQSLEILSKDSFKATVKVGIGFVKGAFNFDVNLLEKTPPSHAKLKAHGSGSGSVIDLDTSIDLTDNPDGGTKLTWTAEAMIGGLLAGVGQRLIGTASEKQVSQLFECIKKNLER